MQHSLTMTFKLLCHWHLDSLGYIAGYFSKYHLHDDKYIDNFKWYLDIHREFWVATLSFLTVCSHSDDIRWCCFVRKFSAHQIHNNQIRYIVRRAFTTIFCCRLKLWINILCSKHFQQSHILVFIYFLSDTSIKMEDFLNLDRNLILHSQQKAMRIKQKIHFPFPHPLKRLFFI